MFGFVLKYAGGERSLEETFRDEAMYLFLTCKDREVIQEQSENDVQAKEKYTEREFQKNYNKTEIYL